ncbi:hypothetical protein SKAU_G00285790 [Synaphobranchus kaupii]|uniref:Uncharacterized protein n=1 Tax=Synaphobranchus kaupii TaxID=118154 RepID=A0A9Q1EXW9_SYNKA|nr:hypothetical protein SKAU_G00285790 [Synaphobranchus kaupii]
MSDPKVMSETGKDDLDLPAAEAMYQKVKRERMKGFAADSAPHPEADAREGSSEQRCRVGNNGARLADSETQPEMVPGEGQRRKPPWPQLIRLVGERQRL